ncbi:MAG: DUF1206 domain-containing protein [Pseudomonadota bacterium]|nr:DUF1206 domain-containing protein [Pseudomonadota bacterium]
MNRMRRIETWARLGYAARGLVYLLLGWLALSTGKALSTGETVKAFEGLPGGAPLLALLTVGLFGYGLYKIYSAIVDLDQEGSEPKGHVIRTARAIGGLGYWLLAFTAAKQLFDGGGAAESGQASGSGGTQQEAATQASQAAGGDLLLIVVGLAVLGVAAAQFVIAYKAKFMEEMPGAPPLVRPAGQIGYAARAIIVAMVGYFFVKAGLDGERVRGFGDALALVQNDHKTLFKLIAGGLMLFGLVSLLMARYRRIEDDDIGAGLRSKAAEHGVS